MVEDLLRGRTAREWSGAPDFSTPEKLPAKYVSDDLRFDFPDWSVQPTEGAGRLPPRPGMARR